MTRQSSDGGIDLVARLPRQVWPIQAQSIQVQAKRWSKPVGRREIAELRGSLSPRMMGVLVTTGNFSKSALVESERPNLLPISLVDGIQLGAVAVDLKLDL